ncbi:MAG: SDR family NAD(P)-dependent oxidoreductase [Alphaproteobacteria bacterium]|nr:MAG: SDR family NAD(P)-dependent oxidoreductase [Alphaproteobacteria bacterium]
MNLDGFSAIITGGASGLGAATARELTSRGVKVTLWDLNEDLGNEVANELGGAFAKVNVSSEEDALAGLEVAMSAHGAPRILINCAGLGRAHKIVGKDGPMPLDDFKFVVETNLIGTFNCSRLVAAEICKTEPMEHGERGAIVNTASVAAFDGQIGQIAYTASKAGIVGMTLVMARDLSNMGIRVNTIAPGIFQTPLFARAPQNVVDSLAASVPFPKRLGEAPEFAAMAVQLCENSYMNGETIRLDGAIRMAPR